MSRFAHIPLLILIFMACGAVQASDSGHSPATLGNASQTFSPEPLGVAPADTGFDDRVEAITTYNGDLIVGGWFFTAAGLNSTRVAGYNGSSWYSMSGIALGNPVTDLHVFNGELYAGYYLPRLNKWDGSSWTELQPYLGVGIQGRIFSLTTHDSDLVVAGNFADDPAQPSYIAKWNGASWDSLGTEIASRGVQDVIVFNGELIAGGFFASTN